MARAGKTDESAFTAKLALAVERRNALSVRQLAAHWAVSTRKIRALIRRGVLQAFNVGGNGRQQLRIAPEAIAEAEKRMAVPQPAPRRKRQPEFDEEIITLLA
jgi:hypothetical protein